MLKTPPLHIKGGPFLDDGVTTPHLMRDVLVALTPAALGAIWFFGLSALLLMATCVGTALLTERLFTPRASTLKDGSAALTGLLLALVLPASLPLWMAVVGSAVAVGLGKVVWGGLGQNIFNPALVGRAFLQAAFPTALTTWSKPGGLSELHQIQPSTFAVPMMQSSTDAITAATPLSVMKFEHLDTPWVDLLIGGVGGSLGETSALLILLGAAYLVARHAFDWRIPVSLVSTVLLFSLVFYALSPEKYPTPWFMLLSGGLLFGAVFMATDPVTCPVTPRGAWVFGIGVGTLVVLIRLFGGLPEGVMYAILLMNAATPLIDRATQPQAFGRGKAP